MTTLRHTPPKELHPIFDGVNCVCDPGNKTPCVYRLWYWNRFIVWKGGSLDTSLHFMKNGLRGYGEDNALSKFYDYIKSNPGFEYRVELVLESDNHYWILREEYNQLQAAKNDPHCLNKSFIPYQLIMRQSNGEWSVGWIKMTWWAHYVRWEKKHSKEKRIRRMPSQRGRKMPAPELAIRE